MKQAVVLILLGQSNAVGHGIPMAEEEKIKIPMKNVFGLSREDNQSLEDRALTWRGYVSGGMNLGETQDHTWSVANCLARRWQDRIDGGKILPDLYIVQIAIGAQGVTQGYMWHPDRAPKLAPGPLETVDISLYPLTRRILSLVPESLRSRGLEPLYRVHWRGGENDMTVPAGALGEVLPDLYRRIFAMIRQALGQQTAPVLHRLICRERAMEMDPTGGYLESMAVINRTFEDLARETGAAVFDIRDCPAYRPDTRQHGIFLEDAVHYTPQANFWTAERILEEFL